MATAIISKVEFMKDPAKVAALVAERDATPPQGGRPVGFKELEMRHGLPPRNGMNAYDVYHRGRGDDLKPTPMQAPRELVRRADVAEVMPAGKPASIDMYVHDVAYGRGWRAGCNFQTQENPQRLECPYPDDEEQLAHAWMDGYDDGKKARRILAAEAKAEAEAHPRRMAQVA